MTDRLTPQRPGSIAAYPTSVSLARWRLAVFRFSPLAAALFILLLLIPASARAQSDSAGASDSNWDISSLLDRLPAFRAFGDLGETNDNAAIPIRYYARPHFGDFIHRDYLRLPVGARAKINEHVELNTEVETYFTHGLGSGSAGYGFSNITVGTKYEQVINKNHPLGWSVGGDFVTPVSRPPMDLTDGHRHFRPYVAFSKKIIESCNLVGYTSLSGDFLSHTALPANFGENELHSNALTYSVGATRDFKRFRLALTALWTTSLLVSDESKNVYALRPDLIVPLTRRPDVQTRSHLVGILSARAVHGPDGNETGITGSIRIEFAAKPNFGK